MGEPYVIVHDGQEVKFCCDGCEPTFKKDPEKFLAKLADQ
jgi:YHS domain-containing protein